MSTSPAIGALLPGREEPDLEIQANQTKRTKEIAPARIWQKTAGKKFEKVNERFDRDDWNDDKKSLEYASQVDE